jgi:hypothetical protein
VILDPLRLDQYILRVVRHFCLLLKS